MIRQKYFASMLIDTYDKAEKELPDLGIIRVVDSETGNKIWVNTSNKAYRDEIRSFEEERQQKLDKELMRSGIDSVRVATDEDIVRPLIKLFKNR